MMPSCPEGKSGSGKSVSAQRLMRILDGIVRVVYHIGVTRAWGADLPEYPTSVANKLALLRAQWVPFELESRKGYMNSGYDQSRT